MYIAHYGIQVDECWLQFLRYMSVEANYKIKSLTKR